MKKLRVGFLLDDLQPNHNVQELIDFVDQNEQFDPPILITGYRNKELKSLIKKLIGKHNHNPFKILDSFLKYFLLRVIKKFETRSVLKRFPKYKVKASKESLESYEKIKVSGLWSKSFLFLEFTNKDLTSISEYNLDCIIRCGSGILKGEILDITEFGVISFHHGDNRVNRGGPSGFWEVLEGKPSSGFIIQKLNQELDGGDVLYRGNLVTNHLWLKNKAILKEKSNVFMMQLLLDLAVKRELPYSEGLRLHGNRLYKFNSSYVLFKYLFTVTAPTIMCTLLKKVLSPKTKRWSVAYSYHNDFSASLWRYKEITNPKGRFLADPFVFEYGGDNYIFVEDFLYKDNKGRISVIKINEDRYEIIGVVLEEDFHLSFPCVFRDGNEIYMIPESSKNSDIRLYRCEKFPNKWVLDQVLMSNISAADTMMIKQEETWFMLTNKCSAGIGDHQAEMHIFYSDELRSNSWQPISSGNPVIFDSQKGRNGGIIQYKEKIYRVNQVHGQAHYGKSFNINEIIKITKDEYIEKRITNVEPNFKKSIVSTHHFSANESIAAVDFARYQRRRLASRS